MYWYYVKTFFSLVLILVLSLVVIAKSHQSSNWFDNRSLLRLERILTGVSTRTLGEKISFLIQIKNLSFVIEKFFFREEETDNVLLPFIVLVIIYGFLNLQCSKKIRNFIYVYIHCIGRFNVPFPIIYTVFHLSEQCIEMHKIQRIT